MNLQNWLGIFSEVHRSVPSIVAIVPVTSFDVLFTLKLFKLSGTLTNTNFDFDDVAFLISVLNFDILLFLIVNHSERRAADNSTYKQLKIPC
jgi:hypothetical protein